MGLYGKAGCWGKGTNFIDAIIAMAAKGEPFKVVNDQTVTPTSTEELSLIISKLLETDNFGTFHLTNRGECTWFEFAQEILRITGHKTELIPVSSKVSLLAQFSIVSIYFKWPPGEAYSPSP